MKRSSASDMDSGPPEASERMALAPTWKKSGVEGMGRQVQRDIMYADIMQYAPRGEITPLGGNSWAHVEPQNNT